MSVQAVREAAARDAGAVDVVPMAIHIGAEIRGIDLTRALSSQQVSAIRAALLRWKVVFFRDQPLDHRQHIAFARQFGETTAGHAVYGSDEQYPQIYSVAKNRKANRFQGHILFRPWSGWHTDITAAINPPAASILRGDIVPPYGGDTQFTNLVAAYNALSPAMRDFIGRLRGVHRFAPPPGVDETPEYRELMRRRTLVSEHPIVRVHPETGERVLFVSPSFLKSIVGLSPRESQVLLEFLWEHIVRPEFTVRFRWEPGSVAFWDNRATSHLAPRDIFDSDFDRQFYRVTLLGDVPVGVDGRPSSAIEGDPIVAA
ncbi:MAG: TauD/TfdA family dioxygenase [Betaproteobacteria bacterium]|nr:TauD/TfdA family dioxygenase [Betaproteobacteria bacterium]